MKECKYFAVPSGRIEFIFHIEDMENTTIVSFFLFFILSFFYFRVARRKQAKVASWQRAMTAMDGTAMGVVPTAPGR